jgi:fatty-acyl-CoA synthase
MVSTAKDLGFDGIEIRGIENELYVPMAKPFLESNMKNTKARLSRLNLEIPCLTSSCFLFDKANIDSYLKEGKEYIDTASRLGTPFIRVLGDASPQPGNPVDIDFTAQNLSLLAEYAEERNVKVLVETNGVFSSSHNILELLKKASHPNVGILWDIHHPFRFMKEPVETTYNSLKPYISFVHIKDSIVENGKIRYRMLGHGDIPVKTAVSLLKDNGYSGYVSLEWVKRWYIDLEEPGIVFSHFINFIKNL